MLGLSSREMFDLLAVCDAGGDDLHFRSDRFHRRDKTAIIDSNGQIVVLFLMAVTMGKRSCSV